MVLAVAVGAVAAFVIVADAAMADGDRATVAATFGAAVFALWCALSLALHVVG